MIRSLARSLTVTTCLLVPIAAAADVVRLDDGTALMGDVSGLSKGALAFGIDFATDDELALDWGNVVGLETDEPLRFWTTDDVDRTGTFRPGAAEGQVVVELTASSAPGEAPGNTITLDVDTIRVIETRLRSEWAWKGGIALGFNATDGNTDTVGFTTRINLGLSRGDHLGEVTYAANYSEDVGAVTARNQKGTARYAYFFTRRLFLGLDGSAEEDVFQDLDLRTVLAIGPGWTFVRKGDFQDPLAEGLLVALTTGVAWLKEDRIGSEGRNAASGRWALDVDWELPYDVTLFHRHEGLVSFEDAKDVLITTVQGLKLKMVSDLNATFEIDWDYNAQPAPGIERTDTTYLTTIGWDFTL